MNQNGRVINVTKKIFPRDVLFQNLNKDKVGKNFQYESMIGIYEPTKLNIVFFSKENVKLIQNMIRYRIWQRSNKEYKIGNQSTVEIQVVMRSIFLQHSPNLNYGITEQIKYLNNLVVEWCIPRIMAEILQYVGYLNDIQKIPMQIDRPINLSSRGTKITRSITTTF